MGFSLLSAGLLLCLLVGSAPLSQAKGKLRKKKHLNQPRVLDASQAAIFPRFVGSGVGKTLRALLIAKINPNLDFTAEPANIICVKVPLTSSCSLQVDLTKAEIKLLAPSRRAEKFENCIHLKYAPISGTTGKAKLTVDMKDLNIVVHAWYNGYSLGKDDPTMALFGVEVKMDLEIDMTTLKITKSKLRYTHKQAKISREGKNPGYGVVYGRMIAYVGADKAEPALQDMVKARLKTALETHDLAKILLDQFSFLDKGKPTILENAKTALTSKTFKMDLDTGQFGVHITQLCVHKLEIMPNNFFFEVQNGDVVFKAKAMTIGVKGHGTTILEAGFDWAAEITIDSLEIKLKWENGRFFSNLQLFYVSDNLATRLNVAPIRFSGGFLRNVAQGKVNSEIQKAVKAPETQTQIKSELTKAIREQIKKANTKLGAM